MIQNKKRIKSLDFWISFFVYKFLVFEKCSKVYVVYDIIASAVMKYYPGQHWYNGRTHVAVSGSETPAELLLQGPETHLLSQLARTHHGRICHVVCISSQIHTPKPTFFFPKPDFLNLTRFFCIYSQNDTPKPTFFFPKPELFPKTRFLNIPRFFIYKTRIFVQQNQFFPKPDIFKQIHSFFFTKPELF